MITHLKSYYYVPRKDKTISLINDNQSIYKVLGKIQQGSKNLIYVGSQRTNKENNNKDNNKNNNKDNNKNNNKDNNKNNNKVKSEDKPEFVLKLFKIDEGQKVEDFEREKTILDLFRDFPEIIHYEHPINLSFQDKEFILIPMKFYKYTDLSTYLYFNLTFNYTEDFIKQISFDILKILKLLKSRCIVHNDIKFSNFLIASENPLKLILTDFETSQMIYPNEKSTLFGGTDVFSSPEFLKEEPHDYASDLWSFGVNLYFSFFKEYPFQIKCNDSRSTILKKIESKKLERLGKISNEAWDLIYKILIVDPKRRLTVEDALNMKWFDGIESKQKNDSQNYDSHINHINFTNEITHF